MTWIYIDSSVVVASLFDELPNNKKIWGSSDNFLSSFILESEVLSTAKREGLDLDLVKKELKKISFVRTESLLAQLTEIFKVGYLRGADAFHLATAMWIQGKHSGLKFYTLDKRQIAIASMFGFETKVY